jgi:flagellar basal body-associated protein FliL
MKMADEKNEENEKKEKNEKKQETPEEKTGEKKSKTGILMWAILAAVVVACASSGLLLGRLFAGTAKPEADKPSQTDQTTSAEPENLRPVNSMTDSESTWFYNELEPIVVNPDVPGATRYVRVGLILEISSSINEEEGKALLTQKNPILINWLNLYFKSLTLDQMENDRDLKRIQSQIADAFNEILFPDAKPQIKRVLIREFNVQ